MTLGNHTEGFVNTDAIFIIEKTSLTIQKPVQHFDSSQWYPSKDWCLHIVCYQQVQPRFHQWQQQAADFTATYNGSRLQLATHNMLTCPWRPAGSRSPSLYFLAAVQYKCHCRWCCNKPLTPYSRALLFYRLTVSNSLPSTLHNNSFIKYN